jgi:hypothetical protein
VGATAAADGDNDYQAVQAWLSLHEAAETQRAFRKEAERLIMANTRLARLRFEDVLDGSAEDD